MALHRMVVGDSRSSVTRVATPGDCRDRRRELSLCRWYRLEHWERRSVASMNGVSRGAGHGGVSGGAGGR